MSIVRVKNGVAAVVYDPSTESHIALTPGAEFDSGDAVVKANGWAFQSDADTKAAKRTTSVPVEQATAAPGELRNVRR